jgi:hypothetical protein
MSIRSAKGEPIPPRHAGIATVYAVYAVFDESEVLLRMYQHQQHAERHRDKLLSPASADARRFCEVRDVKVYSMKVMEDYDGP